MSPPPEWERIPDDVYVPRRAKRRRRPDASVRVFARTERRRIAAARDWWSGRWSAEHDARWAARAAGTAAPAPTDALAAHLSAGWTLVPPPGGDPAAAAALDDFALRPPSPSADADDRVASPSSRVADADGLRPLRLALGLVPPPFAAPPLRAAELKPLAHRLTRLQSAVTAARLAGVACRREA